MSSGPGGARARRAVLRARAELHATAGGPRWRSDPPVVLRPTGTGRVHLVQAAGGPLGGDDLALAVRVDPGESLELCSAGATVAQPGRDGGAAHWTVTAQVGAGGHLHWQPEPTVVCDGADLRASLAVRLAPGATAVLREEVVLGRSGQRGGAYRGELRVDRAGEPLLAHTLLLDGADPALTGPGGTGGCRAVGTLVVAGARGPGGAGEEPGLRWAWSALDGPGSVLLAVGDSAARVAALLDAALADGAAG